MKNKIKVLLVASAFASLALMLDGCTSPYTQEWVAAREAYDEPRIRREAEQIPPHFAAQAAAAFNKGKCYYIWLDQSDTLNVTRDQPLKLKVHYAVAPDKVRLPSPQTVALGSTDTGNTLRSPDGLAFLGLWFGSPEVGVEKGILKTGKMVVYFRRNFSTQQRSGINGNLDAVMAGLNDLDNLENLQDTISNVITVQLHVE